MVVRGRAWGRAWHWPGMAVALARPDPLLGLACTRGGFHRLVKFLWCAVLRRAALPCGRACV